MWFRTSEPLCLVYYMVRAAADHNLWSIPYCLPVFCSICEGCYCWQRITLDELCLLELKYHSIRFGILWTRPFVENQHNNLVIPKYSRNNPSKGEGTPAINKEL